MSGSRPGERRGGRKKGTPNRRTVELLGSLAHLADGKPTPKEIMLRAMWEHWEAGHVAEAVEIAAKVAPYEHPRLNAIDARVEQHTTHSGDDTTAWLIAQLDRLEALEAAEGKAHSADQERATRTTH